MERYALVISVFAAACTATPAEPGEPAEPEAATATAVSELGNACTIQCRDAYTRCNAACLRNPNPNCETSCDSRFLNCMRVCGCPFSEEFDRTVFDHSEPTNTIVCVGPPLGNGFSYRKINMFSRTEHVRRTLDCDGLTTETVLSSTVFPSGTCYSSLFPAQTCTLT